MSSPKKAPRVPSLPYDPDRDLYRVTLSASEIAEILSAVSVVVLNCTHKGCNHLQQRTLGEKLLKTLDPENPLDFDGHLKMLQQMVEEREQEPKEPKEQSA